MKVTFDPAKRDWTLAARGLDFTDADQVFAGPLVEYFDERFDYGEDRLITVGLLRERMVVVVWTPREDGRHIISMRKANEREQAKHSRELEPDPDDAPELDDEWFAKAEVRVGDRVLRKGRPRGSAKDAVSLRLDQAVIDHFRAGGPGWQTRINDALRKVAGL